MKTSKILSSTFYKEHGTGANLTYYHNITVEGESKTLNIGAKQQNPAWLSPGQTLEWEFKDEAKGSIKKVTQKPGYSGGNSQGVGSPSVDPQELRISTGLIAATILYAGGKITKEQINDLSANVARKFDEVKALLT